MSNPWLSVPLADYEGHMKSREVRQLGALADLFAEALAERQPKSVAILGIAGGNGLDRIDSSVTRRIVGLDINHQYLLAVRQRYLSLPGLQLRCIDLAERPVRLKRVQLVHAALIFEHAGTGQCLDNALALVSDGGAFSAVLQLPSKDAEVPSRYPSITTVKSHSLLIDRVSFGKTLQARRFRLIREARRSLAAGKSFWMGIFVRK